ncbi:MAG: hypothetical protein KGO82_20465, partial [Bacteroidota bacterium]|nr:hypothetical protein [Bacteroidota bacterium]
NIYRSVHKRKYSTVGATHHTIVARNAKFPLQWWRKKHGYRCRINHLLIQADASLQAGVECIDPVRGCFDASKAAFAPFIASPNKGRRFTSLTKQNPYPGPYND